MIKAPIAAILCVLMLGCAGCRPTTQTVHRTSDQAKLAKIALESPLGEWRVSQAAARKLTDQSLLGTIALTAKDSRTRDIAAERITDQAVLGKVALESKHADIRETATAKLTDPALLARIAANDTYCEVREAAALKITDQAVLAGIAGKDVYWTVRQAAVSNLLDQVVLLKVAFSDEEVRVRRSALAKLNDLPALEKLSVSAEDPATRLRASALCKLHRAAQSIPETLDRDRLCAESMELLDMLMDPVLSAELGDIESISIMWGGSSQDYYREGSREYAFTRQGERFSLAIKLTKTLKVFSRAWSTEFTHGNYESTEREVAAIRWYEFLNDVFAVLPSFTLPKVAKEGKRPGLRSAAAENLTDQDMLAQIALEDGTPLVRRAAVAKLTDEALLLKVSKEAGDSAVRERALWNLGNR